MGKKREAAWRERFLAALARCGSVTGAARAAGVHRSTIYGARQRDPDFAARCAEALAEGRRRLASGGTPALAGDEVVRRSRHGRPCIALVGPGRWSADKEALFLAALEEGANVRRAARAARISTAALYTRRQREPAFAEAWAAAVRGGYLDVEALLIENAKAVLANAPRPRRKGRLVEDMSVADAINVLKLHRASVKGGAPQRYDWRAAEPDIEEVRAEVLRKVAAMERKGRGQN
jgi:transposase-like protein